MGKYKTLVQEIENATERKVAKRNRISLPAAGMVILGVVALAGGMGFDDPNSAVPTFLYTAGALLLLAGVVKLFVSRSAFVYLPTKSRLKGATFYFSPQESDALQACMEMKRFDDLKQLKREKDTGVKLETLYSADGSFAAVQMLEYVPYTYEAITPALCYYGEDARVLTDYFRQGKID